jgi:hypothetical protein
MIGGMRISQHQSGRERHTALFVPPSASASVILLSVVPVSVPIPMMVMLPAAGTAVPVPVKVTPALVVRCYPPCRRISRASPISGVPLVMVSSCIPVALYPNEIGTGGWRQDPNHTRRRRGPNLDSDGDLAEGECGGKDQECAQFLHFSSP